MTRRDLLNEVVAKAMAYVEAYNEGGHKKSELKNLKDAATIKLDEYNSMVEKATYRKWATEGDPIKTAIRAGKIEGVKRLNYKTDDDNFMTVKCVDADIEVNLPQMQATLGAGVFHDPKWFNKLEKLIWIVAYDINERMTDNPTFEYKVQKASEAFKFPADVDPYTTEGCIEAMNQVFDAILFLDDGNGKNMIHSTPHTTRHGYIDSPEWRLIRESLTKEAGKNKISICNTGKFSNLIMRAMNGILTDGDFEFEADDQYTMPHDAPEAPTVKAPKKRTAKKAKAANKAETTPSK